MPDSWTGEIVGRMHNQNVTYAELAAELKVSKAYVSMILNGARRPSGAKDRFEAALDKIISASSVGETA